MCLRIILFLFACLNLNSQSDSRLALVIGNSNYDVSILKNPVRDGKLISEKLDSLGFETIQAYDLQTQRSFYDVIDVFGEKRENYDIAFVYYAGHATQIDGINYLLPTKEVYNSVRDIKRYGVSAQDILDYLETKSNNVNIFVLDACRNNPYESTRGGTGLADITAPSGSIIAYSASPGKLAFDGDGNNSIYASSLARNMMVEDIPIQQVFINVRTEVEKQTEFSQSPEEEVKLTGSKPFVLRKKDYTVSLDLAEEYIFDDGSEEKLLDALTILEPIIADNPDNSRALNLRHEVYYLKGEYEKALGEINNIIGIDPNNSENYIDRSYIYRMQGKLDLADNDLNTALLKDSLSSWVNYQKGKFYYDIINGEFDNIDYDKEKLQQDFNEFILKVSNELNPNEPIKYFDKSIELDPVNLAAYIRKSNLLRNSSSKDSIRMAINVLNQIEKIDKAQDYAFLSENQYYQDFVAAYFELGDIENVNKYYDRWVKIDSENPDAFFYRSEFKYREGLYDEALADINKSISIFPNDPSYYYSKYEILKKKAEEAKEVLNNVSIISEAFEIIPEYKDFAENRGIDPSSSVTQDMIENPVNFYTDALSNISKAIDIIQSNSYDWCVGNNMQFGSDFFRIFCDIKYFLYARAQLYDELENYALTITDLVSIEYLDKNEDFAREQYFYRFLARTYSLLGDDKKMVEYFQKEVNISPEFGQGYYDLAIYYYHGQSYSESADYFQKAINAERNNLNDKIKYTSEYSQLQFELKNYEKSIEISTQVMELVQGFKLSQNSIGKPVAIGEENLTKAFPQFYYLKSLFQQSQAYSEMGLNSDSLDKLLTIENLIQNNDYDRSILQDYDLYLLIGDSYRLSGDYISAIKYYNIEIINWPSYLLSYQKLAELYALDMYDYNAAERTYKNAFEIEAKEAMEPDYEADYEFINLCLSNINFLYIKKDYDQVIIESDQVILIDENDPQPNYIKALVYIEQEKYLSAYNELVKCIEKIIKYSAEGYFIQNFDGNALGFHEVFLKRALVSEKLNDFELACNDLESAKNYTDEDEEIYKINQIINNKCSKKTL